MKMKKSPTKNLKNDERGIATIVISLLIILLLTLIVLAMSRNANREQRQALDRQLNSQAFYAAESGVNDTIKYVSTPGIDDDKTDCGKVDDAGDGEIYPGIKNIVDTTGPISYSCVLYDKTPSPLSKAVGTNDSWIVPIQAKSGGVDQLTFSWNAIGGEGTADDNFSNCVDTNKDTHLNVNDYYNLQKCKAGFLRVELINPISADRQALIGQDMVIFLAPGDSSSHITRGDNVGKKAGKIYTAKCDDTTNKCTAMISGIGLSGSQKLYLRLKSIYKQNQVEVSGKYNAPDGSATEVQFANAQVMIDSTGKANDILKRIKVYVPINPQAGYKYPEFAIQTNDKICKLLDVIPTRVTDNCE